MLEENETETVFGRSYGLAYPLLDTVASFRTAEELLRPELEGKILPARHALARSLILGANDPHQAPLVAETLANRLKGKPAKMVDEKREVRRTIIYKAGDPPPWLKSERELVELGVLPWPPNGKIGEPPAPALEELGDFPREGG